MAVSDGPWPLKSGASNVGVLYLQLSTDDNGVPGDLLLQQNNKPFVLTWNVDDMAFIVPTGCDPTKISGYRKTT